MFLGSESKLSVPWLDVFLEAKLLMGALMAELLAKPEVFMKAFLPFSFQKGFSRLANISNSY